MPARTGHACYSLRRSASALVACLLALPLSAGEPRPPWIPDPAERDRFLGLDGSRPERRAQDPREFAQVTTQDDFDVTHYLVDLDFEDTTATVSGSVTVTATSVVGGMQGVQLDLADNMTVSRVLQGMTTLVFSQANDLLTVTLAAPVDIGQSFTIRVTFSGAPSPGDLSWNKYPGGASGDMVWSLSEPTGARSWWPCKDRPDDKAMVDEWWTVRPEWTATGNGTLQGVDTLANGRKRYRWSAASPLTTYLVSVAATDYASFSETYTTLEGETMPIDYYVYPEDLSDAEVSFSSTSAMLGFFAETFGEYPFVADKYGMSEFPFGGAMEHTTNTSYGHVLITGTNVYDYINAHEIAHQWWGDSISPETWPDIWLNEGFASYSEALWTEQIAGTQGYRDYMQSLYRSFFAGSVYDPDILFSATVYDKGAWVVHMLRGVMGDEAFFQSLRSWYEDGKDGVGNTVQLQANQEAAHGGPLDWFFQQWVYGQSRPTYELGYSTADVGNGVFRHYVKIRQVQVDAGTFSMPVQLTLVTSSGSEIHTVWNDAADQDFVLETDAPLTEMVFDEPNWILKHGPTAIALADTDFDGVPDALDNCRSVSNADQQNFDGDVHGDLCDDDDDNDLLLDLEDCAPSDPEQGTPSPVATLSVQDSGAPVVTLAWTAAARADGYDVIRGLLGQLHQGYGSCLVTALAELSYVDVDPVPTADGFLYLVRGRDDGCGGAGSLGADSSGNPRPSACP